MSQLPAQWAESLSGAMSQPPTWTHPASHRHHYSLWSSDIFRTVVHLCYYAACLWLGSMSRHLPCRAWRRCSSGPRWICLRWSRHRLFGLGGVLFTAGARISCHSSFLFLSRIFWLRASVGLSSVFRFVWISLSAVFRSLASFLQIFAPALAFPAKVIRNLSLSLLSFCSKEALF